jgi:hypothetical protein
MAVKSLQGAWVAPTITWICANKVSALEEFVKGIGLYRTCREKGVGLMEDYDLGVAHNLFRSLECDSIRRHR